MSAKVLRLLFVGAPGVGKGTYSSRAAVSLRCHAVSSGDLLRKEVARGTPIGKQVKGLIETGVFVPDELITKMMVQHIASLSADKECPNGYILDGYPRNISQAASLWTSGDIKIDHVINLTQPRSVIMKKLSSRRSCPGCGFVYNLASIDEGGIRMDPLKPKVNGVCDKCGCTKPLITRKDDDIDVITKRQDEYSSVAMPLLRFYKEKGVLHDFPIGGGTDMCLPKLFELISSLD
ncbi:hypothetical protein CUR178_05352 [Leishmania enriettii]|uniref:Adenylate kinase active site lid domain-containing protein n=1 Tax=Leishmania enriettii TaxID=5663 RepID=A0A836GM36_LEIEN|nr:hypothetical protein CUR178_05352 [Leishmania enriettii]